MHPLRTRSIVRRAITSLFERTRSASVGTPSRLIEPLETRTLLAANLRITDAYLADGNGNELTSVAAGQVVFVQAEFDATDLAAGTSYDVRTSLGNQEQTRTVNWGQGVPGNSNWFVRLGPWLVPVGGASATATLDAANAIAETSEIDNARTFQFGAQTFAPKFVKPIEGDMGTDWAFVNYTDTDRLPDTCTDPSGGTYCYDGHNGWDLTLANFHAMDESYDVYAAAAGTVVEAVDGNFDRETGREHPTPNYVTIDHGNGWRTRYLHLRKYSVEVRVGDAVAAGQRIGLVGSSGSSDIAHLHWEVQYNGRIVEPGVSPETYLRWSQPYPTTLPSILDSGITNIVPGAEMAERPSPAEYFPAAGGQPVYVWARIAGFEAGDSMTVRWFRPNGTQHSTFTSNPVSHFGWQYFILNLPMNPVQGEWQAALLVNGVEQARESFFVSPTLHPQARMYFGPDYFVDGRTTPFDYGTVAEGQGNRPIGIFTVRNSGAANLLTSDMSVPAGFTVIEPLSAVIPPGGSDTFTVRLDNATPGHKIGYVTFKTNDPSLGDDVLSFRVEGRVTSANEMIATILGPADDVVYLRRNGDATDVWVQKALNLPPTATIAAARVSALIINTLAGHDNVSLDYANGDPLHGGSLTIHGGAGDDVVGILNAAAPVAVNAAATLVGVATINHTGIEYHEVTTSIAALDVADGLFVDVIGQAGRMTLSHLTLGAGAKLDLGDNDLVVTGGDLATIEALVASARNAPSRWQGPGIGTHAPAGVTGLAVGRQGSDVLVKFTYNGDANLDGRINSDDYFRIDSGFLAQPTDPTYAQGDFNYDGQINSDDYFLIDSAFLGQTAPLAAAGSGVESRLSSTTFATEAGVTNVARRSSTTTRRVADIFQTTVRVSRPVRR